MFQDIFPHIYHNEFSDRGPREGDRLLSFSGEGLLCRVEDGILLLPRWEQVGMPGQVRYLFSVDETGYFLQEDGAPISAQGWERHKTYGLRECRTDESLFAMAAAESLWRWLEGNRFCGRCGGKMEWGTTERSRVCTCGNTVYPKICPAVIVAVHDGDRLLLTRYKGRPFKRYALVAGFNEIGESIEDTVRREVWEETGLRVKDLQFYKSQPWVFTDSLLMGFYARLDGSDAVTIQEDELAEANWFDRSELPEDYSPISLTGEMIRVFRQGGPL